MEVLDGGKIESGEEVKGTETDPYKNHPFRQSGFDPSEYVAGNADKAQEVRDLLRKAEVTGAAIGSSLGARLPYPADDYGYADKITVYRDKAREWRWRRTSPNGEIVGASHEGFKNFTDCRDNLNRSFCMAQIADVVVED